MQLKWKMKNGEKIFIRDMTDSHLINAMKLLIRFASQERARCIIFYLTASPLIGEMAFDAFEREQDHAFDSDLDDFLPDSYYDLVREFEKRKLDEDIVAYMREWTDKSDSMAINARVDR